jgi:hypothetical protein
VRKEIQSVFDLLKLERERRESMGVAIDTAFNRMGDI